MIYLRKGSVFVYYGDGRGKTTLAVGQGLRAVGEGNSVIMIQFLDYNNTKEGIPLRKLEPDFKIFRFEKMRDCFECKDEAIQKEVSQEIGQAFNFAKKIVETGECDLLILDGIMEAIEYGYVNEDELCLILDKKMSYMDIILTGKVVRGKTSEKADYVYKICTEKVRSE